MPVSLYLIYTFKQFLDGGKNYYFISYICFSFPDTAVEQPNTDFPDTAVNNLTLPDTAV